MVVSTSVCHAVDLGSMPGPDMLYFRCKNLALNIRDCVTLVRRGSSVVGAPVSKLGQVLLFVQILNEKCTLSDKEQLQRCSGLHWENYANQLLYALKILRCDLS